jgi:orotidine-5'-phosphate decarboxylase
MNRKPEFIAKLEERWKAGVFVSVGLDPEISKLPSHLREAHASPEEAFFVFNRAVIDATASVACAFKPNAAFYEAEGDQGWRALKRTAKYLKEAYPDIPVILDAKRGDIGSTNEAYARAIFDDLEMDAVTIHPYLGREAVQPFLDRKDRGVFVLVRTSNPGAGEFQDLKIGEEELYRIVAGNVASGWNGAGNVGVVVGATYPEELKTVREIVGDMPILVPGIGAQGGDVAKTVAAGKGKNAFGMLIHSSRSIIYASGGEDYAEAAGNQATLLSEEIARALG